VKSFCKIILSGGISACIRQVYCFRLSRTFVGLSAVQSHLVIGNVPLTKDIRRFRGVTTIEEYLEKRTILAK
jgi:hypothetical protein